MSRDIHFILTRIEVLLAEQAHLAQQGPHLKVICRSNEYSGDRIPREDVWTIVLTYRGKEVPLPLSFSPGLLLAYLCRTRHIPQCASQIAISIRDADCHHNHSGYSHAPMRRRISRSSIKTYIARIRKALDYAIKRLGAPLKSNQVLVSEEEIGSNRVLYRLRATVEWVHLNHQGGGTKVFDY